jgi:hypothetical protein
MCALYSDLSITSEKNRICTLLHLLRRLYKEGVTAATLGSLRLRLALHQQRRCIRGWGDHLMRFRFDAGAVRLLGLAIGLGLVGCGSGGGGKAGAGGHGGASDAAVDQTRKTDGGRTDAPSTGGAAGKAGAPVVLATGFDVAGSLASDGTSVFFGGENWHEDGGLVREARLVQVPIAGGPMTTRFAWSDANPEGDNEFGGGIVVDGANLFFCAGHHALRMPIAAGAAVDLMPPSSSIPDYGCWLPVVDATNLYSGSDSNFAEVFSIPKAGGTANLFAGTYASSPATYASRSMASDGTYVYWVPGGTYDNTMQRALGAGGPPETIVSPGPTDAGAFQYLGFTTSNLVIAGGYIYWMEFGTGYLPYVLWRVPLTGGTPVVVTSGSAIYQGLVSDGTSLYWFEGTNGVYSIKKTSVTPGSAVTTVVADAVAVSGNDSSIPPRFTVDDTNVYWLYPPNLYKAPK